jgi:hypothetical protein
VSPFTRRMDMHGRLYQLYRRAVEYAELLAAAGNYERAEQVRQEAADVARFHDLDHIRQGEWP